MQSALVTGASRGIGHGIAQELARQGYGLTITSRAHDDLVACASEFEHLGSPAVELKAADMADTFGLPALVELHGRSFGSMDALIISAGVGSAGPVRSYPKKRLERTFSVNFTAPAVLIQESIPWLQIAADNDPSRAARIIALSSITGLYAESNLAYYGASKAALLSLVETVNAEEARNGICATAVAPGYVETDMSAWVTDAVPAEQMLRIGDIVAVVNMLLSMSRSASITKIAMTRSTGPNYGA